MLHSIKLIGKEQQTTNIWAGGTTTQLAIYPEDASYADRNFTWRLSSAVVELEESTFTSLPGYDRALMVLKGELELVHEGHHSIKLKQFEQDSLFKGEWNTKSYGRARDFNLMLREDVSGRLIYNKVMPQQTLYEVYFNSEDEEQFAAYYCYTGTVEISLDEQQFIVKEGELLLAHYSGNMKINFKGLGESKSDLISIQIYI